MRGTIRQVFVCLLVLMLALGVLPPNLARAEEVTPASRHDLSFVTPAKVDIWEDGCNIYIRHNGDQYQLGADASVSDNQIIRDYLVTVETYPDIDGELVTVIYFNIMYQVAGHDFAFTGETSDSDGSVYHDIYFGDVPRGCNKWNPTIYYVTIKNGKMSEVVKARVVHGTGGFTVAHEGTIYADDRFAERSGRIYVTPFTQGRYKIYCSRPVRKNLDGDILYPETPLPGTSSTDGDGLYKTTFRMLTDGALTYNTFYYSDCYLSAAGTISASGTILMDATQLSDGTTHRQQLSAPQLLCQISSYGTVYDIVYTNDDNLCKLLGINRPQELRWNVAMQRWVSVAWDDLINSGPSEGWDDLVTDVITPDHTNPFNPDDTIPAITGLSVSPIGMDARILYEDYSTLYGNALLYLAEDTSVKQTPWGLGSSLSWTLGDNGSGHTIDLRIAARVTVQLSDGKTRYHTLIIHDYSGRHPGNNKNWSVSAESGQCRVALYDLIILLQQQYKDYNNHPPTKLLDVQYALTPFYTDGGQYYRGKTAYTTQVMDTAYQSVPVDNTIPTIPDPWDPIVDGSVWDAIKDLVGSIPEFISWIGDLLSQGIGLFSMLGQVPAMLASIVPFIPEELWTVISFGILLYFAPAIVRGIRNLIMSGLGG